MLYIQVWGCESTAEDRFKKLCSTHLEHLGKGKAGKLLARMRVEHGTSKCFFGAKANKDHTLNGLESVAGMVCEVCSNVRPAKQLRLVRGWDSRGPVNAQDRSQAPRLFHHRCRGCDKSYVDSLAEPLAEVRFRRPLSMPRAAPLHIF